MSWYEFWSNVGNTKLATSQYLYSLKHIICLVLVVACCIALTLIFRKKSQKAKNTLLKCFGFFFLFWEVSTRIVNLIFTTDYSFSNILSIILPMHICSVIVWVFIITCFTRKQTIINFSVICGLLATGAFLLYPATGFVFQDWTFTVFYSVTSHAVGFVCAVLLITLGYVDFSKEKLPNVLLCFALMFVWGVIVDFLIFPGSNYMFLVKAPVDILPTIPHQIIYGLLLLVYVLTFFVIYNLRKKTQRA